MFTSLDTSVEQVLNNWTVVIDVISVIHILRMQYGVGFRPIRWRDFIGFSQARTQAHRLSYWSCWSNLEYFQYVKFINVIQACCTNRLLVFLFNVFLEFSLYLRFSFDFHFDLKFLLLDPFAYYKIFSTFLFLDPVGVVQVLRSLGSGGDDVAVLRA